MFTQFPVFGDYINSNFS